jgi:hypothetical protein
MTIRKRLDFSIFADHRQIVLKVSVADGADQVPEFLLAAVSRMQKGNCESPPPGDNQTAKPNA